MNAPKVVSPLAQPPAWSVTLLFIASLIQEQVHSRGKSVRIVRKCVGETRQIGEKLRSMNLA